MVLVLSGRVSCYRVRWRELLWHITARCCRNRGSGFWLLCFYLCGFSLCCPPNIIYLSEVIKKNNMIEESADVSVLFTYYCTASVAEVDFVAAWLDAETAYAEAGEGREEDTPDPGCWTELGVHAGYWYCSAFFASYFDWVVRVAGIGWKLASIDLNWSFLFFSISSIGFIDLQFLLRDILQSTFRSMISGWLPFKLEGVVDGYTGHGYIIFVWWNDDSS